MSHSDMLDAAMKYASYGWAVFPVHSIRDGKCTCGKSNCTSPGKHPLTRHGFHDAATDSEIIYHWWKKNPWANIAIATGEISGRLMVIDIDRKPDRMVNGEETWEEIEQDCPATVEVLTGGGGRHLYFIYPDHVDLKSGTNVLGPGVDIRADGGYVLAPPSLHASGRRYEWEASGDPIEGVPVALAPVWLLNGQAKLVRPVVDSTPSVELLPAAKVNELRSALAFINSDDRDVWLRVGMALKSTNTGQQAYGLWTEWSMQSEKYDPRDQQRTWQSLDPNGGVSLSTIFWMAKENGWMEMQPIVAAREITPQLISEAPYVIDEDLINPPGILGEIVQYIVSTARRPQQEFAVNAALALAGTVLGRRFISDEEHRTNLYLVSIGVSTSGKDHPRKMVKNILNAACQYDMIGGETIASGQGLLARVKRTPVVLFQLDEFGLMLQALQQKNSSRYSREIPMNMIRLFSSSDSVFGGTEYADQVNRPTALIEYPCVSIHATTTPETFYSALDSKDIINGFLNRFLVVDMSTKPIPPIEKRGLYPDVPDSILVWIERVINANAKKGNMTRFNVPQPIVVPSASDAAVLLREFTQYADLQVVAFAKTGIDSLWGRAAEHAHKVALICACAETTDSPVIRYSHAQWAIHFVSHHTEYLAKQVSLRIVDTEFERQMSQFYIAILTSGSKGVTERDMNRRKPFCSHPPKDRKPIIETLLKGGRIVFTKIESTGAGRPRVAYVACDIDAEKTDDE
ncbi:MAG: bifunctional DNA primase/polymerase [Candidatus Hatepunaea meridiana]|nr:bifunctional DNA primase/polymerase [Candidatus Hatepunaea meridiana]